jgi:hypothetical protein
MSVTSPNTSYGYHLQSGNGSVDGVDSWNPDDFTPGDQHFGNIVGRDVNSHFGRSVDTDFQGTRLVGGGPEYDNNRGYIQIYDWSETSTTWTSLQQINGPSAGGWFGESISMDYDGVRIIVGAPKINTVYVYDVGSNGLFSLSQTISTSDDSFGHSVSIAGDTGDRFAVGAPNINSVFVYERNSGGTFVRVHTNVGTNITNRVPTTNTNYITLYSKFNGYGFSVKMAGFGEHIIVGAPGTEIAEIQCSNHAGTTTPGPISHHLGEHVTSTQGPHYTGTTSYACSTQFKGNARDLKSTHPYSSYKYPGTQTNNNGNPANGLRFNDAYGNKHHPDTSPYGTNASSHNDGYLYPNFQMGNIRIIKCPERGSWSSGVTTIQTIEGRNINSVVNLGNWDNIYSSFPGFGRSVSISVDGKRICAGSPGFKPFGYDAQAMHGDVRYFVFNGDTGQYDEPMNTREGSVPSLGGPWTMLQKNQVGAGFNMSMTDDGSRVFVGSREHQYALIPYDFSGTTFYPAGPIVMSGGTGSGPDPTVFGTAAPVPDITGGIGCLNGYRSAAHSGTNFVVSFPSYPEAFGANVQPPTANQMARGIILIYRYTLTSVFRGNSLFEGYVKCDNLTVGSSGGSVDHARIKFGGRKGEVNSESGATIENRWLGTRNAVYTGVSGSGYKHDNELLISKSYNTLHEPNDTVKHGDWNKRDFFGDRVRIKAPKIEFQIHTPQSDQLNNKYRESPCVSITDMNNPFGGERGMSYLSNPLADEPRQLMSIRTGTSNSRLQAGLRLIAGSSAGYVYGSTDLRSSIPSDGRYYTFAPGNDGWLRLLQPSSQGTIATHYDSETDGAGNSIGSNYAPLAVGDLYVKGAISGPGAPASGGGSSVWSTSGTSIYYTSGNVGVGTANPQGPFHVLGRIINGPSTNTTGNPGMTGVLISNVGTGDSTCTVRVANSQAGDPFISFDVPSAAGWSWGIDNSDGYKMKLGQNWNSVSTNTKLTVQTDGRVGIGYTSIGANDMLAVNGRTYSIGFWNASDDRVKYNETTIPNPLDLVNQLKPQKYDKLYEFSSTPEGYWIPTDEEWENVKDNYKHSPELGFIAQDIRKIPELSFLVSGDETEMVQKNISPDDYNTLDSAEQATYTSIYVHITDETRISSEEYANLTTEEQDKYFLKYTKDIETQTPLSLDYTGLSVLTTSALQEVDRQLQAEKMKNAELTERVHILEQLYHGILERVVQLESSTGV